MKRAAGDSDMVIVDTVRQLEWVHPLLVSSGYVKAARDLAGRVFEVRTNDRGLIEGISATIPANAHEPTARMVLAWELAPGALPLPLPEEPVGIGAQWQITTEGKTGKLRSEGQATLPPQVSHDQFIAPGHALAGHGRIRSDASLKNPVDVGAAFTTTATDTFTTMMNTSSSHFVTVQARVGRLDH